MAAKGPERRRVALVLFSSFEKQIVHWRESSAAREETPITMSDFMQKAKAAIDRVFDDLFSSRRETRANLYELIEECERLIGLLDEDSDNE